MSVNYTAHIFVGAEISDSHFFADGTGTLNCRRHGKQDKAFCGECGTECYAEHEKIWTPEMKRAAEQSKTTPEELWDVISPDGGFSSYSDTGTLGRWKFGYESEQILYGTIVATQSDDERPKPGLTTDDMNAAIKAVQDSFKAYGIETPVRVICIQDCG